MKELSEKKPIFRIMETKNGFYVQRQFTFTEKLPKKWWEKQRYSLITEFRSVAEDGGRINIPFEKYEPLRPFKTLEEAKEAIEQFKKYPIYHYPAIKPEFPKDRN